jgi:hypothetical protein
MISLQSHFSHRNSHPAFLSDTVNPNLTYKSLIYSRYYSHELPVRSSEGVHHQPSFLKNKLAPDVFSLTWDTYYMIFALNFFIGVL